MLARTNNFELKVRAVELAQQGFRVDLARNERYPTISVGPSISEERAGDRERIIGVGISLPLPLWNRNQGAIEAAVARLELELALVEPARSPRIPPTSAARRSSCSTSGRFSSSDWGAAAVDRR